MRHFLQVHAQTEEEALAISARLRAWEIAHSMPLPASLGGYVVCCELRGTVTRPTVRRLLGAVPPCPEIHYPGAPSLLRGVLFSETELPEVE